MDCAEFRRRLGAEPLADDADLRAHRDACPECARAWARARDFEHALAGALADIPVPAGLLDDILARTTRAEPTPIRRRRVPFALAMAASLLVAVIGAAGVWHYRDAHSLPALAVAHMPEEITTLDLTRPADPQAIVADFAGRGVTLKGPLPTGTTYVNQCEVGPYKVVHLVSRDDGESVAVLYLPHKHLDAVRDFRREGWQGREVPLAQGTLVMLTDRGDRQPFDAIARGWRMAIDGPGEASAGEAAPVAP